MKLYFSKGACSLAVQIVINEIGASCALEAVNLGTKKTSTGADFFAINPKGSVPTLITDDQQVLTENAVIQQYLADTYQAHALLPAIGDFQRYRVLEWLNFVSTDLHKGCSPLFNANVPNDVKDAVFKPLLKARLTYIAAHLQQHNYLVGDHFTLPDSYLFVVLSWLPYFKIDLKEWPALVTYVDTLKQRDSIKKALNDQSETSA